jgi:hypothetical protein
MLTLLAPDIVDAILGGRQPAQLGVHVLREGFPVEWGEQRATWTINDGGVHAGSLTSMLRVDVY